MARLIALTALAALGLPTAPVHDPVHTVSGVVITESNRAWKPGPPAAAGPSFGLVTNYQRRTQEDTDDRRIAADPRLGL
jgi:hypothetical protein